MNVKNKGYQNLLVELLFIQNIHPWGLHILYLIKKLLPLTLVHFINSPLELINFAFFDMWNSHHGLMVPKSFIFSKVLNWFLWSLWFSLDVLQFQWMVFDRSYNFWFGIFCNILQFVLLLVVKVIASFISIFGYFNHSQLPMCPTSTLSFKT